MARSLEAVLSDVLPQLRYLSSIRRVRVRLGPQLVADSTRAVLVWEPMRIVASYALPVVDLLAELVPAEAGPPPTTPQLASARTVRRCWIPRSRSRCTRPTAVR